MVEQSLQQSQQLKQEQVITHQQIQSLEILQAPLLELQAKITQELAQNPVLEQESPIGEPLLAENDSDEDANERNKQNGDSQDEKLAELVQLAESWQNYLPPSNSFKTITAEDEEKRKHYYDSIAEEPSLQEQLLEQLRFMECDPKTTELVELIIGSIDERGYLRSNLKDLATVGMVSMAEMEKALKIVQGFDPPGIGARDLKECLLLQLRAKGRKNSKAAEIVEHYLGEMGSNKLPFVAKKIGVSMDKLEKILAEIRSLNPYPGSLLSSENPVFIIPELVVEKKGDEFFVQPKNDSLPRIRISDKYLKMLEDPNLPPDAKEYIKNKILQGKNIIKCVDQRKETMRQIADIILDSQYDFFRKGVEFLKPLTMQQVADKLGMHETTVSRAISNKFMQTPMGLFELKYFFSPGFQSDSGEELSNRSVMKKIQDMIDGEDASKPLSDQDITDILKKEGLPVARRTVAKYREALGILSSRIRKEF